MKAILVLLLTVPAYSQVFSFGIRGGVPLTDADKHALVAFLKTLFDVGYLKADGSSRAAVSFEIKPLPDEDQDVMLAAAKRKLGEAWQRLKL